MILSTLRSVALLALYAFAAFMLVAAPIELYKVHQSRDWPRYEARLTDARIDRDAESGQAYVVYRIVDPVTRGELTTSDVRPGDFPLTVDAGPFTLYSSQRNDRARYAGQHWITIYRAPDGRHFFLERGDYTLMSLIWLASAALLLWLLVNLKRPRPVTDTVMTLAQREHFAKDLAARLEARFRRSG